MHNNNNNNNNNPRTIFIVLSSWPLKVSARVHSVHLMNAAQRTSGCRPSDQALTKRTWAVSPPVGSYRLQPPSPFIIIITQPESWYSFTVPSRVEGWVDLGTAGRVHTARAQGCKSQRLWIMQPTRLKRSPSSLPASSSKLVIVCWCGKLWWRVATSHLDRMIWNGLKTLKVFYLLLTCHIASDCYAHKGINPREPQ